MGRPLLLLFLGLAGALAGFGLLADRALVREAAASAELSSARVFGLELGADDYVPKPFAVHELLARVRALLRRARREIRSAPETLVLGGVRFDFRGLTARGPTGDPGLTTHDVLVLKVLAARRGEVVSRLDIIEEVCGLDSDATLRTVDNHIVALRRVIGDDPKRPHFLHTVRGEGYRLSLPEG